MAHDLRRANRLGPGRRGSPRPRAARGLGILPPCRRRGRRAERPGAGGRGSPRLLDRSSTCGGRAGRGPRCPPGSGTLPRSCLRARRRTSSSAASACSSWSGPTTTTPGAASPSGGTAARRPADSPPRASGKAVRPTSSSPTGPRCTSTGDRPNRRHSPPGSGWCTAGTPKPDASHPAGHVATLAELAPDQLAAVGHRTGPARVIAPAGSGKTRVLTERLRHLVADRGVAPGHRHRPGLQQQGGRASCRSAARTSTGRPAHTSAR